MTALQPDMFFVWFLKLQERFCLWRATATDTHRSFSDANLCEYTASPYTHCYLVHNYTTIETHVPYITAYYTPNNAFTANDALFYKNKFG